MTCNDCPKRENCTEMCSMLANQLPSLEQGSLTKLLANTHQTLREVYENIRWVEMMLWNREMLEENELKVFNAYYVDSLTSQEIAEKFDLDAAQVIGLLKRIYNKFRQQIRFNYKMKFHKQLKREEDEMLGIAVESDDENEDEDNIDNNMEDDDDSIDEKYCE